MTTNQNFHIVDGPGKYELMVSLFSKGETITLTIETALKSKEIFKVHTRGVAQEDGSCTNWLIKGFVGHVNYPNETTNFEGYYNSTSRVGWVKLEEGEGRVRAMLEGRRIIFGQSQRRVQLGIPVKQ